LDTTPDPGKGEKEELLHCVVFHLGQSGQWLRFGDFLQRKVGLPNAAIVGYVLVQRNAAIDLAW